ncbi:hypothetical protein OT109_03330 [Phycisphaeraceae bacterium D3-23]
MDAIDTRHLSKLPKWVFYFWAGFVVVTLLTTLQQSTFLFYGPDRVLYGNEVTMTGTADRAWAENLALLIVPAVWLLVWCSQRLKIAMFIAVAGLMSFAVWHWCAFEILGQTGVSSYRWSFTGEPGRGLAGFFSNKTILHALLDPADATESVLGIVGWLAFLVMFFSGNFYAMNRARGIGRVCTECEYDLRGTPSGMCPECGHANPSYRHKVNAE